MRAILSLFGGGDTAPAIPPELVAAIEAAFCYERGQPDPETGEVRTYCRVATIGEWRWQGVDDARDRILRNWPELTPRQAGRAAVLVLAKVAQANREAVQGQRRARGGKFAPPKPICDMGTGFYDR